MNRSMCFAGLAMLVLFLFVGSADAQSLLQRPDGSNIQYSLNQAEGTGTHGIAVLLQGSGCHPVGKNQNIATIAALFTNFTTLIVEKYGVEMYGPLPDGDLDCPEDFYAQHTVSQRVVDYVRVIVHLRDQPWWDGTIVLFGGSEGGNVAAILGARVEADAAILLSTGGGMTFGEAILQTVPEEGWASVNAAFAHARENSQSAEVWAGSSYRYWADALDRRVADNMLEARTAFLLIQGGSDVSSPVSSARITSDLFAENGRCNLTYWEFAGYNHAMVDSQGKSHMGDVVDSAIQWANQQLSRGGDC